MMMPPSDMHRSFQDQCSLAWAVLFLVLGGCSGEDWNATRMGAAEHPSDEADTALAQTDRALGEDCQRDPLEAKKPLGRGFYQQLRGIFGCTTPADVDLYRRMLPAKFETPSNPEVCFYITDFQISGVGPYREAAILLPVTHGGRKGEYVLTMALDNSAATYGGRAIGFPKYIADEVAVTSSGGANWTARARNRGVIDLQASFTNLCRAVDSFPFPDFINLTPIQPGAPVREAFLSPRSGAALMVPAVHLVAPAYYSLQGKVRLTIGDHLPWNGLVDESSDFDALLVTFKGGIDLGRTPLDRAGADLTP